MCSLIHQLCLSPSSVSHPGGKRATTAQRLKAWPPELKSTGSHTWLEKNPTEGRKPPQKHSFLQDIVEAKARRRSCLSKPSQAKRRSNQICHSSVRLYDGHKSWNTRRSTCRIEPSGGGISYSLCVSPSRCIVIRCVSLWTLLPHTGAQLRINAPADAGCSRPHSRSISAAAYCLNPGGNLKSHDRDTWRLKCLHGWMPYGDFLLDFGWMHALKLHLMSFCAFQVITKSSRRGYSWWRVVANAAMKGQLLLLR